MQVDPGTQLAERSVGVDGHHAVILTQLREGRPDAGRDDGLPIRVDGVVVMDHKLGRR
jgi:hypothetical protein